MQNALQNVRYMDVFYREGYRSWRWKLGTVAIYEMVRAQHPVNGS